MPPTGRTRRASPLRDRGGTYLKVCGSNIHDETSDGSKTLFNIEKGKKLKRKTSDFMLENNIISKRSKYVCQSCVHKVEHNSLPVSEPSTESCDAQFPNPSASDDVVLKCTAVCDYLEKIIRKDISALYNDSEKCKMDNLLMYDPAKWLSERPPVLVGLLSKLCGFSTTPDASQQFLLSKCVELIYGCRNKNLVLPLSFQENLLVYSLSRNKQLVTYNSKVCPSGSIETMSKWMTEQASQPIHFPDGLVRSVFDNEQVIGRTHRIKADNKVPSSIITSHMNIILDPTSKLQSDSTLAPKQWLFEEPSEIQKQYFLQNDLPNAHVNLIRETRNIFIRERLASVVAEQKDKTDFLNELIEKKDEKNSEKVCIECGAENERTARKCTNCCGPLIFEKFDMSKYGKKVNPYHHFTSIDSNVNDFKVQTGEPDMCNPSSFHNVSEILFNLANRAGIKQYGDGDREWLFLECDGGIYTIVEKLLYNVFHCKKCGEAFYGKESFAEHRCSILHDVSPENEFGWLIPMPGLLHVEMNACKSFFELNWDIFMQDVCTILGYKSPRALDCAKRCVDHHKTFKILEILYMAGADELLVPYVRHCSEVDVVPSVDGYWEWASDALSPNYIYLQQMVFTFLHSIMLFRTGCRRGNVDAILAGRDRLSLLFYGRNHPRYQRIMAINQLIESMMPEGLRQVVFSSFTLSRVGNIGHYQGGDACLEELNKEAKSWISPTGVPSEKDWQQVFRNLDSLNKVRKQFINLATGEGDKTRYSTEPAVHYSEVVPVRELFRRRQYLLRPREEEEHTSVNGEVKLFEKLHNFTAEAEARRHQFFNALIDGDLTSRLSVIYVSKEEMAEKECISSQTKVDIEKKIFLQLEQMENSESKLMEELFNKTVKGKNKEAYISFYHTLANDN